MDRDVDDNVDGLYLVTFFCVPPYSTQVCEVEISVHLGMYLKKPGLIPESFGANLEFCELSKSTNSEP